MQEADTFGTYGNCDGLAININQLMKVQFF